MYNEMKRWTCSILLNQATQRFVFLYELLVTFLRHGKKEKIYYLVKISVLRVTVTTTQNTRMYWSIRDEHNIVNKHTQPIKHRGAKRKRETLLQFSAHANNKHRSRGHVTYLLYTCIAFIWLVVTNLLGVAAQCTHG